MKSLFGIWYSPLGDFYKGMWAENRPNGIGIYNSSNNEKYFG